MCFEEEFNRLEHAKKIARFGLQSPLPPTASIPCEDCLKFGVKSNKERANTSLLCNLCKVEENVTLRDEKTKVLVPEDQTKPQKLHLPNCPCSCNKAPLSTTDVIVNYR